MSIQAHRWQMTKPGEPFDRVAFEATPGVGEVVVETYALVVPASLPPGVYPISIGWRDAQGGWLPVSEEPAESRAEPAAVFVGNIDVRR